jgi:hypothetical protein
MVEIAEIAQQQLNVEDTRVDGGGEMLFVAGGVVKRLPDPALEFRSDH